MEDKTDFASTQTVAVFRASDFSVTDGVTLGEEISFADELLMDEIYQLAPLAKRCELTIAVDETVGGFVVVPGSDTGTPGNAVSLDCCITVMGPDSSTYEALILVEILHDEVENIFLLPLADLELSVDYRLVGVDRHAATKRFAEVACASFVRGTHITLATGEQRLIENLKVGDSLLTRDDGPQKIQWIGHTTLRAMGAFAPVFIAKGALHNENDLLLGPDHRIFIYQREDRVGAGRAEILVKVRHLINGDTVYRQAGGFVDYYQLLFDDHQIIYAEGISAESLLIDPRTRPALSDVANELNKDTHAHRVHLDYEIQESLLSQPDAVALLRNASSR